MFGFAIITSMKQRYQLGSSSFFKHIETLHIGEVTLRDLKFLLHPYPWESCALPQGGILRYIQ